MNCFKSFWQCASLHKTKLPCNIIWQLISVGEVLCNYMRVLWSKVSFKSVSLCCITITVCQDAKCIAVTHHITEYKKFWTRFVALWSNWLIIVCKHILCWVCYNLELHRTTKSCESIYLLHNWKHLCYSPSVIFHTARELQDLLPPHSCNYEHLC